VSLNSKLPSISFYSAIKEMIHFSNKFKFYFIKLITQIFQSNLSLNKKQLKNCLEMKLICQLNPWNIVTNTDHFYWNIVLFFCTFLLSFSLFVLLLAKALMLINYFSYLCVETCQCAPQFIHQWCPFFSSLFFSFQRNNYWSILAKKTKRWYHQIKCIMLLTYLILT